jgi:hypothetical protein
MILVTADFPKTDPFEHGNGRFVITDNGSDELPKIEAPREVVEKRSESAASVPLASVIRANCQMDFGDMIVLKQASSPDVSDDLVFQKYAEKHKVRVGIVSFHPGLDVREGLAQGPAADDQGRIQVVSQGQHLRLPFVHVLDGYLFEDDTVAIDHVKS